MSSSSLNRSSFTAHSRRGGPEPTLCELGREINPLRYFHISHSLHINSHLVLIDIIPKSSPSPIILNSCRSSLVRPSHGSNRIPNASHDLIASHLVLIPFPTRHQLLPNILRLRASQRVRVRRLMHTPHMSALGAHLKD